MRSCAIITALAVAACQETTTDNFVNPPPGVPATCTAIAGLPGCDQGSISYSCTSDRPDDVGSDTGKGDTAQLVCSDGVAGALGASLFCCIPLSQEFTGCAPDTGIGGCTDSAVGFACTSQGTPPTAPSDADATIACSAGRLGNDGVWRYCCNTTAIPPTCTVDAGASCPGVAVAYACASGAAPTDAGAPFTCTTSSGGRFCCTL